MIRRYGPSASARAEKAAVAAVKWTDFLIGTIGAVCGTARHAYVQHTTTDLSAFLRNY